MGIQYLSPMHPHKQNLQYLLILCSFCFAFQHIIGLLSLVILTWSLNFCFFKIDCEPRPHDKSVKSLKCILFFNSLSVLFYNMIYSLLEGKKLKYYFP